MEEFDIVENVNLGIEDTGIGMGTICISSSIGSGICRIKYFPDIHNNSVSFVVEVPSFEIIGDNGMIGDCIRKEVIDYAIKNQEDILKFWVDGYMWNYKVVHQFVSGLKPI